MIVLRHGVPREPITGKLGIPTLFVKFTDGRAFPTAMAGHTTEEIAEMMRNHPGYGKDFIEDLEGIDPYKSTRKETEPGHNITEIDYGHIGKKVSPPKNLQSVPSEQREVIVKMASELAKEIVKSMIEKKELSLPSKKESVVSHTDSSDVKFTCSKGCGKTSPTKAGIMAHERNCKSNKEENVYDDKPLELDEQIKT